MLKVTSSRQRNRDNHSAFFFINFVLFLFRLSYFVDAAESRALADSEVTISNCKKGRCRLRKNTRVTIEMKLQPDHDVESLRTNVNAIVLGVPLPFVGVDGKSAKNNLFLEDGETKALFPLKAGTKYVYKNSFPVESFYPTIPSLDVHWALKEGNRGDLVCFEIPAKLTN